MTIRNLAEALAAGKDPADEIRKLFEELGLAELEFKVQNALQEPVGSQAQ